MRPKKINKKMVLNKQTNGCNSGYRRFGSIGRGIYRELRFIHQHYLSGAM